MGLRQQLGAFGTEFVRTAPVGRPVPDEARLEELHASFALDSAIRRRFNTMHDGPGTQRAYVNGKPFSAQPAVTEEGKKLLSGQTAVGVVKS